MPGGRVKRRVGVCTSCRQDKVHCDSETNFPCTRCKVRGLHCAIDPKFKRTPARQRIQSMADELRQLKEAYGSPGPSSRTETSPQSGQSCSDQAQSLHSPPENLFTLPSNGSFELGLQSFDETEIDYRFGIYVDHFHDLLPVLDLDISKDYLYEHCTFLFWAIITVTCRYEPLQHHDQA